VDTVGNMGGWITNVIERDTVSPVAPVVNVSKTGSIWAEYLSLNLTQSEATSTATIEVYLNQDGNSDESGKLIKTITAVISQGGSYSNLNLIGKLVCGGGKYSVRVKLTDRALNDSQYSQSESITTEDCPRCGYSGGDFAAPIRDDGFGNPVQWVITQDFYTHGGSTDMATVGQPNYGHGIPVYPIAPGRIVVAKYQGGVPGIYGKDNHVLIDHGNGLRAWYVHFMNETDEDMQKLPKVGDNIDTNTVIGHLGNTGKFRTGYTGIYAGTHLHLQVIENGTNIDPRFKFGDRPNVTCYSYNQGDEPYEGLNADNLGEVELEFTKVSNLFGSSIRFDKAKIPAPKFTNVTKNDNGEYIIHGIAIKKYQPAIAKIYEEKCTLWVFDCKRELVEEKELNIEHTEVKAWKKTNFGDSQIFQVWDGDRFSFGKRIPGDLNTDQEIYATSIIYGEFDCLGLKCDYGKIFNQSPESEKIQPAKMVGSALEKPFKVNSGKDFSINQLRLYASPNREQYLNGYNSNSEKPNVWIISHGLENTYEQMTQLASKIYQENTNDIIILLDWGGARPTTIAKSPSDTDQWIRPTAEEVVKKLQTWGLYEPGKIRLVGHSMGSIMINEIAREYRQATIRYNSQSTPQINNLNIPNLYFLDPPNFVPLTNNYEVDTRSGASDQYYTETRGYDYHYNFATISRAFTGIKKNGQGNWCGNSRLNRTANESISIYFNDKKEIWAPPLRECKIHGNVHQVFGRLITDQKLTFDSNQKLNLYNQGVANYPDTQFYEDDYEFNASISVRGDNDIQTIMTRDIPNPNQFNLWGKSGGALYYNFNYDLPGAKNKKLLAIKTFGNNDAGWDRISLEYNSGEAVKDGDIIHRYRIATTNNKPTIYRTVEMFEAGIFGISNPKYTTIISEFPEMSVEGGRSGEIDETSLQQAELGLSDKIFNLR